MPKRTHRNPDHVQRHNTPSQNNQALADHLKALLTPAVWGQQGYYRQLGMAAVLTLLGRQVPGVQELTLLLEREDLLWCRATKVSQQALSERFLTFPAELFERVFKDLLPKFQQNWQQRSKRPLPDSIKFARKHFERIWVADGSTLEALFCKLKSLEDVPRGQRSREKSAL